MKKKWLWAIGLALVLPIIGLYGCSVASPTTIEAVNLGGQQEGIWVTGQGKVTAVPDIATLRLGIEAQEATVSEAQTQAAEAMDEVMTALIDNEVAEKDIQTQYFSIRQVRRWSETRDQEIVVGYRVTNMVTAKIRDIDKVGSIIDAVAVAGGDLTRIDNISFSIDDPSAYFEEARQKAMADAEAKAELLARLAGVSLGKPTYISEGIQIPPPIYPRAVYEEVPIPAPALPPISPGEMEISLTLQVAYAILD
ncbi:MAG: DUF541 domain-containing protein [Dehalococcoidia bacterium]|nr:MAG: DUF541 domain-containing protein [Dehalococcoidia bacterium]